MPPVPLGYILFSGLIGDGGAGCGLGCAEVAPLLDVLHVAGAVFDPHGARYGVVMEEAVLVHHRRSHL